MATRYNYTGGIVTDGLVLHLDAAKRDSYPGSGTTWHDLSGNGNDGTLTNGPTFSGVAKDAAIEFDGSNDVVELPAANTILDDTYYTIECWIKSSDDGTSSGQYATFIGTRVGKNASLARNSNGGQAMFLFDTVAEGNTNLVGTSVVFDENWHHIVGTFDNGVGKLYVDGVLENTATKTAPADLSSESSVIFGIGRDPSSTSRIFSGEIAIGTVYNRALTASEISQNFNAQRGRYGI